ncbi:MULTISPECIES: vWA domain-containing protein [Methylomicrobium]|uniref:Mg-chelatase subunit ChlD n=1 Tax=Methylomicrobium album BG8 TaxID=686340 RepID=H8GKI0_METAL|nr:MULTISPECIES: VWA domain-containing protein [Methylomicrobium]EIC27988.1 Mg-chelatase subunit ChlD [Methylomicrobium album BG8]
MIHLVWPWLILVLPLPWLIRWLLPPLLPAEQAAMKVPFLEDFADGGTRAVSRPRQWPLRLAALAWLLLVAAGMRPQWLGEPIEQTVSGRDLMLAIDLSGSMEEQDFVINKQQVDRLTAAKWVAGDFIERRVGDRMGLILFGTQAYLQTPLTFDRKTVKTLLQESFINMAGENTAIGDAIGLAIKRLKNQPANSRVLILMTDGANTAGEVSPLKAAELAAEHHLKIYTIGIGADEMIVRSLFGARKVNPSRDLDEKTLLDIAQKTGGRYFRARNTRELDNIYLLLDQLEPINKDSQFFRPRRELFYWPLGLALALAGAIGLSRLRES